MLTCTRLIPRFCPNAAESARGVSPRAAHRSGLDTLASSGSSHRTKAAASRRELELLLLPVGSLPTSVACPLRSTGITPLQHYYGAVRPSPAHQYFRPRGWSRLCLFPWHRRPGSHVPYKSQIELRAASMPDAAWAVSVIYHADPRGMATLRCWSHLTR